MKTIALMIQALQFAEQTDDADERRLLIGEAAGVLSIVHEAIAQGMTTDQVDALMPEAKRARLADRLKAATESGDVTGRLDYILKKHGEKVATEVADHAKLIANAAGRAWATRDDVDQALEEALSCGGCLQPQTFPHRSLDDCDEEARRREGLPVA